MDDASGLRVASLRRRTAATAIDVLLLVPVIGAIVWGYFVYMRRRDPEGGPVRRPDPSRRWQVLFSLARAALVVWGRNWRSPGFRLLGLRRADAVTGGPVSLRSGLIPAAFSVALRGLISQSHPGCPMSVRRPPCRRPAGVRCSSCSRPTHRPCAHRVIRRSWTGSPAR